jgi:outer membrane protein assembly factor BamB
MEQAGWAAPTVTTNGQHVAAIFATGELVAVSMEGERAWARHLGVPKNDYGHASSLMSHKGLLFVQYDQAADPKLMAFDLASGEPVWQAKRDAASWSSPILVDNKGRMELILTNSRSVDGYDPLTGARLWHVECLGGEVASSAAYSDGIVFVSSETTGVAAVDIGGHSPQPKVLWRWDDALPDASSPLAKDGHVIVPTAFGVVSCLDAKTGKLRWEKEFDRGFWSSPILVGDRVYLIDLSGVMQVFKLGGEFELLAASEIGEEAYATPAVVGDRIYIRGLGRLFCVGARPK